MSRPNVQTFKDTISSNNNLQIYGQRQNMKSVPDMISVSTLACRFRRVHH